MTTYYFDANAGLDSNSGLSTTAAKRTLSGINIATSNRYLFARGGLYQINDIYKDIGNNSYMGAYGVGARPIMQNPTGTGNMLFNCSSSGRSNIVIEDIDFNCSTNSGSINQAIYFASQNAGIVQNVTIRRSLFHGSLNRSGCALSAESTSSGYLSNFLFEDCEFYNNGEHGLFLMGRNHTVRRCKAYMNGLNSVYGGHGISARYGRDSFTSGWSYAAGVASQSVAANKTNIDYVRILSGTASSTYQLLTKNESTPTNPSAGQFGVSGTTLYINIGMDPSNSHNISYAWSKTENILYEDCEAWSNLFTPLSPYYEGHGLVFDDFTQNSSMRRCRSFNNDGFGFGINQGSNNTIQSCISTGNRRAAVTVSGLRNSIINLTGINNNLGGLGVVDAAEVRFAGNADNGIIRNSCIVGTQTYGIDAPNFASTRSTLTVENCTIYGPTSRVQSGISETNPISSNPKIDLSGKPDSTSPLFGVGIQNKYSRDTEGKLMANPPSVGAYEKDFQRASAGTRGTR